MSSRSEVERIKSSLILTAELLAGKVLADLALGSPIKLAHLAIRLPAIVIRLKRLITACEAMIQQFSSAETRLVAGMTLEVGAVTGLIGNFSVSAKQVGNSYDGVGTPSLSEATTRLKQLEGYASPRIRVEKYQGAAIVYLPGTKTGSFGWNSNSMDMKTNLQEFVGQPSNVQLGVRQALDLAGVKPTDRLMLIGHSQGGLAAMSIAEASGKGNFPYNVAKVITFGSPVGQKFPNISVKVLSVENSSDLVPRLDLAENPESPNWLTLKPNITKDPINVHLMESYSQGLLDLPLSREQKDYVKQFEDFSDSKAEVTFYELNQGQGSVVQ